MKIKVSVWHDDGSYQEYDGKGHLESFVEEEAEYIVTTEEGNEYIVQAPATKSQLAELARLEEEEGEGSW